jgi:hypothetical protein
VFVILAWTMALLMPAAYWYAREGTVPELEKISAFILAQVGLFAPYIFNQLAAAVKALRKGGGVGGIGMNPTTNPSESAFRKGGLWAAPNRVLNF